MGFETTIPVFAQVKIIHASDRDPNVISASTLKQEFQMHIPHGAMCEIVYS
jgi:hypothetical protein